MTKEDCHVVEIDPISHAVDIVVLGKPSSTLVHGLVFTKTHTCQESCQLIIVFFFFPIRRENGDNLDSRINPKVYALIHFFVRSYDLPKFITTPKCSCYTVETVCVSARPGNMFPCFAKASEYHRQ